MSSPETTLLAGTPDEWRNSRGHIRRFAGTRWLNAFLNRCHEASRTRDANYTIDLSNVEFITLSTAVAFVATLEQLLADPLTRYVEIDIKGPSSERLLTPEELITATDRIRNTQEPISSGVAESTRIYRLAGFLESLGTLDALNAPARVGKASYRWLEQSRAKLKSFHTKSDGGQTVVMRMMRIESKEHYKQFLDSQQIVAWREEMGERFRDSPLFESEELWRIFCHELSVNIYEHSQAAGFLAARVVDLEALDRQWPRMSYRSDIYSIFTRSTGGFIELCVSDAGQGFVATLERAYRLQAGVPVDAPISPDMILAFAFDEVGTCKNANETWATERHALGRILQLVAKYGGGLNLTSGGAEVTYVSRGGSFERFPNHLGFRPTAIRHLASTRGSHLQLLLPLIPLLSDPYRSGRRSVLETALPSSFQADPNHVRGHLVPLLEALDAREPCVGTEELLHFRKKAETLAQELIQQRPSLEPLILDFSALRWTPAQLETLLHFFQNVLQHRPVLLVEIDPALAREVVELETQRAPTQLGSAMADKTPSITGRAYHELSEKGFLETYARVHATVLALDIHGNRFIFGLASRNFEEILLSLISTPKTLAELLKGRPQNEQRVLRAILNNINPLFYVGADGRWRTAWDAQALANEARRVMSRHFEHVAEQCHAWRGREAAMTFNLPWQEEWVSEFFESARILSRQRHADEAAQRLIFRLRKGLEFSGRSLSEVKVLACITAPAILLAAALHRWWPLVDRPAIADLGPYLMLHPDSPLPAIASSGGIVIVQDVLDKGKISNRLVRLLRDQHKDVLGVISLVGLVADSTHVGVTDIVDGWSSPHADPKATNTHAMVRLLRGKSCPPSDHDDPQAHWVEPRTLRPFPYRILRRELKEKQTSRERLRPFFIPREQGLVCAGHYVYGERHYTVALDMKRALDGEIGDEIALWVSDVCQGVPRSSSPWESERGRALHGDVTAVLIPLHSQIHYLWPRVENLLAQRGRRQPIWLLDATLFLGHGPAYRLPLQFIQQITRVTKELKEQRSPKRRINSKLRIVVLDDAMVTGRTIETIVSEINRTVAKANESLTPQGKSLRIICPIEWIRYLAVFNYMGHARHQHWRDITSVGANPSIPFVFDEYRSVTGVPVFEEVDCPSCADVRRFERLVDTAQRHNAEAARLWASARLGRLRPVAIDSPGFHQPNPVRLPRSIDVLARSPSPSPIDRYQAWNADEAILRFWELMYMSYPPTDVLGSLSPPNAWFIAGDDARIVAEYERFRWAVLEWCLRNWPRLIADSSRSAFFQCAKAEVDADTALIEPILEALARHRNDKRVKEFVLSILEDLTTSESQRHLEKGQDRISGSRRRLLLENAVSLFFLNVPKDALASITVSVSGTTITLLERVTQLAASLAKGEVSFIGALHLSLTRPRRYADPGWALQAVAETLLRGRDRDDPVAGSHRLLPRLLSDVDLGTATNEDRRLLQCNLSLFIAALEDLMPFAAEQAIPVAQINDLGVAVLAWLNLPNTDPDFSNPPRAVTKMIDALSLQSEFCTKFDRMFHESVENLRTHLEEGAQEILKRGGTLDFKFEPDESVRQIRILAPVQRLQSFLTNWAIDFVGSKKGPFKSRIEVSSQRMSVGSDHLKFRILTNFEKLPTTIEQTVHGRNYDVEVRMLRMFGGDLPDDAWQSPGPNNPDFTAMYEFIMPVGIIPKQRS